MKKLRGKSATVSDKQSTIKYDITGQPTPAGHVYPTPLHETGEVCVRMTYTGQFTPIIHTGPLWEYQIIYEVTPKMLKMTVKNHVDANFTCVTA